MFKIFKKIISKEEQQRNIDKALLKNEGIINIDIKEITEELERNSWIFQEVKNGKIPVYKVRSK